MPFITSAEGRKEHIIIDERQKKILEIARANNANPLMESIIEFADVIAEECLADKIYLNGNLIYQSETKK
jgi:hypothetical protein